MWRDGSVPLMRLPCLSNAAHLPKGFASGSQQACPLVLQVLDELPDKIRKRIPVEVHAAGR